MKARDYLRHVLVQTGLDRFQSLLEDTEYLDGRLTGAELAAVGRLVAGCLLKSHAAGHLPEIQALHAVRDHYDRVDAAAAHTPRAGRDERTLYRWTAADADRLAGRTLTDEELAAIADALDHSTAGEVFGDVVFSAAGYPDDAGDA